MNYFRSTEEFHIDFMVGKHLEPCFFSLLFTCSKLLTNRAKKILSVA